MSTSRARTETELFHIDILSLNAGSEFKCLSSLNSFDLTLGIVFFSQRHFPIVRDLLILQRKRKLREMFKTNFGVETAGTGPGESGGVRIRKMFFIAGIGIISLLTLVLVLILVLRAPSSKSTAFPSIFHVIFKITEKHEKRNFWRENGI